MVKLEFIGKNWGQKIKKGVQGGKNFAGNQKKSPPLAKKGSHPEKRELLTTSLSLVESIID